jgi:cytochrome c biogenesis protein CcmG, thiol:disulfide interchange protein DsbE
MGFVRKMVAWGAVALAAGILVLFAMPSYRQGEASIAGKTAQDFPLIVADKSERLSDFHGKVVVLNFFGAWCQPCIEETPGLNRLQRYIAPRNGVVLGVSADEDPAKYEEFLKQQGVIFTTYRDPSTTGSLSQIAKSYGTSVYPETYVIDRRGKIARKFIGFQQWDSPEMLAYFDSILGQS